MHNKNNKLLLLTLLLLGAFAAPVQAQTYRILLSNDDGIGSPLLHALHDALEALPNTEVVVSAPNENKSGSSQASDGTPIVVERYLRDGEFFGYSVHGRPADAVRFAIVEMSDPQPFDLVVSGINRGANVGDVSHLSGTVGAAMEGIYHGIPAIAVSEDTTGVDTAASARFAANLVRRYQNEGAPEGIVISVNIPRGELQGVVVRPMGDSYLQTADYEVEEEDGDRTVYNRIRTIARSEDDKTDTFAYQQGYITITPLRFDWTAYDFMAEAESWNLSLD